ncbi:hypothetical protein KR032_008439, partial [Drosophila birchii]
MGASNSKPQTVQMTNPIQITRDVADRINQATVKNMTLGAPFCETCKLRGEKSQHMVDEPREVQPVNVSKSWKKRSSDVEESHFDQSVKRIKELFSTPKKWSIDCQSDIRNFEVEIINCYHRYPNESLQCSDLVKQYNHFVFRKQNAEVAKMKSEP